MNRERMQNLLVAVEGADPAKFDMEIWRSKCGTVGCAAGHYIFRFPDAGLVFGKEDAPTTGTESSRAYGKWYEAMLSLAEHFGISKDEAVRLFDPEEYQRNGKDEYNEPCVTKDDVVERIKLMLAS